MLNDTVQNTDLCNTRNIHSVQMGTGAPRTQGTHWSTVWRKKKMALCLHFLPLYHLHWWHHSELESVLSRAAASRSRPYALLPNGKQGFHLVFTASNDNCLDTRLRAGTTNPFSTSALYADLHKLVIKFTDVPDVINVCVIICGDLDLSERSRLSLLAGRSLVQTPCWAPGFGSTRHQSDLQRWAHHQGAIETFRFQRVLRFLFYRFNLIKSHMSFLCIYIVMLWLRWIKWIWAQSWLSSVASHKRKLPERVLHLF